MSDKLMALIDRYAHLIYKSRTEPASKYVLREYDAIRCRMDIEEALSEARSQAYEEIAQRILSQRYVSEDMRKQLAQAIRQHSQKGEDNE